MLHADASTGSWNSVRKLVGSFDVWVFNHFRLEVWVSTHSCAWPPSRVNGNISLGMAHTFSNFSCLELGHWRATPTLHPHLLMAHHLLQIALSGKFLHSNWICTPWVVHRFYETLKSYLAAESHILAPGAGRDFPSLRFRATGEQSHYHCPHWGLVGGRVVVGSLVKSNVFTTKQVIWHKNWHDVIISIKTYALINQHKNIMSVFSNMVRDAGTNVQTCEPGVCARAA